VAYDGSGNFIRLFNWVTDKVNGINITASRVDAEDAGFAAGLSLCVTRDGQGAPTADFLPTSDNSLNNGSAVKRWASFNGTPAANITPIVASKAATLSRSNTNVLAADPDLQVPIVATGTYIFEALLNVWGTTTSTQGIKWNLYAVGTPTFTFAAGVMRSDWIVPTAASNFGISSAITPGGPSITDIGATSIGNQIITLKGGFIATAVSGATLGISWAQFSSSANAANVGLGSYLKVQKIA
jgi:hypothetical protein